MFPESSLVAMVTAQPAFHGPPWVPHPLTIQMENLHQCLLDKGRAVPEIQNWLG